MSEEKPTTEKLISELKQKLPLLMGAIPEEIKAEVGMWPSEEEIANLAPENVEDFFELYFDDAHVAAINKAAGSASLLDPTGNGALLILGSKKANEYHGKKVADIVSDHEVLPSANVAQTQPEAEHTAEEPTVTTPPVSANTPAPISKERGTKAMGELAALSLAATPLTDKDKGSETYDIVKEGPVAQKIVYKPLNTTSTQYSAPGAQAGADNKNANGTVKKEVQKAPSGAVINDDGDGKMDEILAKAEKHPVLAGMMLGLMGAGAKAMSGKASFGDVFVFMLIGALAGFLFDKFNNNTSANRGFFDGNRSCDTERGYSPHNIPPQFNNGPDVRMSFNHYGAGSGFGYSPTNFLGHHGHGRGHDCK